MSSPDDNISLSSAELDAVFPLQRNIPLNTEGVVQAIGSYQRQFAMEMVQLSDFPQPVEVITREGRTVRSMLQNVFCDGGSQKDGTFYFEDVVRKDGVGKGNYFFGNEIVSITFLDEGQEERG